MKDYEYECPEITIMETDEAIHIIRKPNEKTIRKEIHPPVLIKTKPEILIERQHIIEKRLTLPPSKCDLTINERFTMVLCRIQKQSIEPNFGDLRCPNTLFGRLQRCKAARAAAAPYTTTPHQSNLSTPVPKVSGLSRCKGLEPPTRISALDMFNEPESHVPGESLSSTFAKFMNARNYNTGPSKSKNELDDEIEEYYLSVGGRGKRIFKRRLENEMADGSTTIDQDEEVDEKNFDLNDGISNIKINCTFKADPDEREREPNLFSKFVKHIKSRYNVNSEKQDLDEDLDDYFGKKRRPKTISQSLDDDLEAYKRQDPRNQQNTRQSMATTNHVNNDDQEDDELEEYIDNP